MLLVGLLLEVVGDVWESFDLAERSVGQPLSEGIGDCEAAHNSRGATLAVVTLCLDTLNFHLFSSFLLGVVPCLWVHYDHVRAPCQYLLADYFKNYGVMQFDDT